LATVRSEEESLVPTSGGDEIIIRPGTTNESRVCARLHSSQISEGFLSHLGPRFLGPLYRRIARSDGSFLLVAVRKGQVAGFIAGSTDLGGLYKQFMLREGIGAALASAPRLLMSWRRVLETLRHSDKAPASVRPVSELLSIAVDPDAQGSGIGGRLVDAFLEETGRRNIASAQVVVGKENTRAVSLYSRAGFTTAEEFEMHKGVVSLLMTCTVRVP
jgi:ribosomal protein S18 acetylase RimI-like enzyme